MVVEQMARCAWNARPDERGLCGRMAWNPHVANQVLESPVTAVLVDQIIQVIEYLLDALPGLSFRAVVQVQPDDRSA